MTQFFRSATLFAFATAALLGTAPPATAQPVAPVDAAAGPAHWVASWTASLTAPYGTETLPPGTLDNATLRETVHLSAGGTEIRLHLSNAFGEQPLLLRRVTVALPAGAGKPTGAVEPASVRPVVFDGETAVTIPPGAEYLSDPLRLRVKPGSDLVVSLSIASAPAAATLHAGARATEYLLQGDHASDATLPGAATNMRWYFLAGVEVGAAADATALVAFGDSITDGHGATTDGNDRWPDNLARRLQGNPRTASVAVANQGIGGNCLLQVCIGPPALARFDRDVVAVPGVRSVMVLEGINDLGALSRKEPQPAATHTELVQRIEGAYLQMIARAHAHGIRVVGATLTPWMGSEYYHPDAAAEADRVAVNTWIRQSGRFDAVVDFDTAVRDPNQPNRLLPAYDSGDHLHPGPEGYRKMAAAIDPAQLFAR